MDNLRVYVVITSGENDGERFHEVLGVFANLSDAKATMLQDIEQIKNDWNHIDFNDSEDWVSTEEELSYEGFTPCDEYQYSAVISEMPVL